MHPGLSYLLNVIASSVTLGLGVGALGIASKRLCGLTITARESNLIMFATLFVLSLSRAITDVRIALLIIAAVCGSRFVTLALGYHRGFHKPPE